MADCSATAPDCTLGGTTDDFCMKRVLLNVANQRDTDYLIISGFKDEGIKPEYRDQGYFKCVPKMFADYVLTVSRLTDEIGVTAIYSIIPVQDHSGSTPSTNNTSDNSSLSTNSSEATNQTYPSTSDPSDNSTTSENNTASDNSTTNQTTDDQTNLTDDGNSTDPGLSNQTNSSGNATLPDNTTEPTDDSN